MASMRAPRVVALSALVVAGGVIGCGRTARQETALVVGRGGDLISLDPAVSLATGDHTVFDLCYERLLRFGLGEGGSTGELEGELASSWAPSEDGTVWTFVLSEGHAFDDGTPVTAEAVKFTFERILGVGQGPSQGAFWLDHVEVVDPLTVRFHMRHPFPPMLAILTLPNTSIVNPAIMAHQVDDDHATAWLSTRSAGSGPYRVLAWERNQKVILEANPHAATRPRYFERAVLAVVQDPAARRLQLQKGDLDVNAAVGAAEAEQYARLAGVRLVRQPASNVLSYLVLNTEQAPLDDARVRRAIALAIDYDGLVDQVLEGNASKLAGPIPPGVPGYDPELPEPVRDVARARALLAEAGRADGLGLTLGVSLPGPVSETIQSNLADVGITVTLERLAGSAMDDQRASGAFDMLYDAWNVDMPDPWSILEFMYSSRYVGTGGNFSRYSNPEVDRLLLAAIMTPDDVERVAIYRQVQRLVVDDAPVVFLYAPYSIVALGDNLRGYLLDPFQPWALNVADMYRVDASR